MGNFAKTGFVCIFLTIALSFSAGETPTVSEIRINVYNDARVPTQVLTQAIQEATRIFRKIGIGIAWIDCSSGAGSNQNYECQQLWAARRLSLRIVPWSSNFGDTVFGVAFLSPEGDGTYCDVFYDSVEKLHQDWHVNTSRVLGNSIAHEIGHLLLGTNAHSFIGIMAPNWQAEELRRIEMGTLFFTPEQARSIHTRLASFVYWPPR